MNAIPRSLLSHGSHEMTLKGNLLSVEAYGPWNREAAEEYCDRVRSITSDLIKANKEWAVNIAIHGTGIYTPDSLELLRELHQWRLENGMKRIAIVCDTCESDGSDILKMQLLSVYESEEASTQVERYFIDRSQATKWLNDLGFGVKKRCCL